MKPKILNKEEIKRFAEHIEPDFNQNIFFSGAFGVGKTYFINEFFEQKKEKYIPIKLFPVNYSVSNNEDIFEYIKFDIAFQLLKLPLEFDKLSVDDSAFGSVYLEQNLKEIISILIENLSKIGHRVNAVYQTIEKLINHIKKVQQEIELNEEKELHDFLHNFINQKGTIYEENHFTDLLNGLIDTVKNNNSHKEIVLVIDDLDRIDPEHIFRLLNVFSAHLDYYNTGENKFGFEKIILIGDVDNIRNIFHTRYGSSTSFSGYIDKFYSTSIFSFDNRESLKAQLSVILANIELPENIESEYLNEKRNYSYIILMNILIEMVNSGSLNIRRFKTLSKAEYPTIGNINFNRSSNINSNQTPILFLIDFLKKLSGGHRELIDNLKKTKATKPKDHLDSDVDELLFLYGNLAMILDHRKSQLRPKEETYSYKNTEYDFQIDYMIIASNYSRIGNARFLKPLKPIDPVADSLKENQQKIQISSMPKYGLIIHVAEIINSLK